MFCNYSYLQSKCMKLSFMESSKSGHIYKAGGCLNKVTLPVSFITSILKQCPLIHSHYLQMRTFYCISLSVH